MKRKLLLLALLALSLSAVQAQTKLKWNALYWAMGVVNMSAETKLTDKWTFNGDAVYIIAKTKCDQNKKRNAKIMA